MSITDLNWLEDPTSKFRYPNLVEIQSPQDGSCFFHSICLAFYKPYIFAETGLFQTKRSDIIKQFRYELSSKLGERIDPNNESSPIYYDILSNGNLRSLGQADSTYSLKSLQAIISNYSKHVDHSLHEFVSDALNKDIYFLDARKKEVYRYGKNLGILYKKRPSIVLMYHTEHFNLVGVRNSDGIIDTLFDPNHHLIQEINKHL